MSKSKNTKYKLDINATNISISSVNSNGLINNNIEIIVTVLDVNNIGVSGNTVTVIGSDSSSYNGTDNNDGTYTFTVTGSGITVSFTATDTTTNISSNSVSLTFSLIRKIRSLIKLPFKIKSPSNVPTIFNFKPYKLPFNNINTIKINKPLIKPIVHQVIKPIIEITEIKNIKSIKKEPLVPEIKLKPKSMKLFKPKK